MQTLRWSLDMSSGAKSARESSAVTERSSLSPPCCHQGNPCERTTLEIRKITTRWKERLTRVWSFVCYVVCRWHFRFSSFRISRVSFCFICISSARQAFLFFQRAASQHLLEMRSEGKGNTGRRVLEWWAK